MTTDHEWTWTIVLANGRVFHVDEAVTLAVALTRFYDQGGQETEIEAVIRH